MTECIQLMRKSEDHVEVGDLQHLPFSCGEPTLASLRLALHAMPVAAGVVRDGLIIATGTLVNVATQLRRAAAGDSPQYGELLEVQPGTLFQEAIALLAEYIGHFHGRPAHSGFRFFRERSSCAGSEMQILSSGSLLLGDGVAKGADKLSLLPDRSAPKSSGSYVSRRQIPACVSRSYAGKAFSYCS